MKTLTYVSLMLTFALALPAFATVVVNSPSNGETVGSSVNFVASANTTTCSRGVAAMGLYIDNSLDAVENGVNLSRTVAVSPGSHKVVIQEWDYCGGATSAELAITSNTSAGVVVTTPTANSTVPTVASYVATANSSCNRGVASMGVYVDGQLSTVAQGSKLNAQVNMSAGSHNTVVQAWDYCGGSTSKAIPVTVAGGGGSSVANVQALNGWHQWGELAPSYNICSPCSGVNWSMLQHQGYISLTGNATRFTLGGSTPYSDVLFSNPVIGQGNVEGLTDQNHTLLPSLHNFTLDTYTYVTNLGITQSLEYDINMYMEGVGMEWGTQCNHLGDGVWDIWDNVNAHWMPTGVPCQLNNASWNHITIQVQRESNNDLLYQTITVNGITHSINRTVAPFAVPGQWWGMTINFQMDGNHNQSYNTTYVDKTTFTYF